MSRNFPLSTSPANLWRRMAAIYLCCQSVGATIWWILLSFHPPTRSRFVLPDAPDSALLAFGFPDALLFIGAGAIAAWQFIRNRPHARDWLLLHSGGALYAALYCLHAFLLDSRAWPAALAMSPCLIVLPLLLWKLNLQPSEVPDSNAPLSK